MSIEIAFVVFGLSALTLGYVIGYKAKSAAAHNEARRRRLNATLIRTQAALNDLPPRQTTADVRRTRP